jgi:hypothetical protein
MDADEKTGSPAVAFMLTFGLPKGSAALKQMALLPVLKLLPTGNWAMKLRSALCLGCCVKKTWTVIGSLRRLLLSLSERAGREHGALRLN